MGNGPRRRRGAAPVVRDAALTYLREPSCAVVGEHRPDVACTSCAPAVQREHGPQRHDAGWSGLLLRVDNEAQLVAILGHEAGHYPERDSLKGLRSAKDKSAAAMVLGMLGPWARSRA